MDTRQRGADREFVRAFFAAALLALSSIVVMACNTTEGFGKDVEEVGDAIEDAADDAND